MTSYQISERYNAQTGIWFVARRSWRLLRGAAWGAWLALDAFGGLCQYLQLVIVVGGALLGILGAVAVVVACIPPTFWLGLLIIGAFGWATFPRTKAVKA